jgi:hypothetical protein
MAREKLSEAKVRKTNQPGMYGDGGGLWLRIEGGSKTWVYRFMIAGRARSMGFGPYPDVSLADARARAMEGDAPR